MNKNDLRVKKARRDAKIEKNKGKVFPILGTRFNRAFRRNAGLMADYRDKVSVLSDNKE